MTLSQTSSSSGSLIRDALTGAYSRALFQERWPDELERAHRYNTPLALCILDVDYFKSINDAFGHHRGDLILRELVHRIWLLIRGSDILFRYGGDEFLLLLPNTTREQAGELCERTLKAIGNSSFPGDPPISLSASIGIAGFPFDGADGENLFHVADLRCYEAKRRGRNRVIFTEDQKEIASQTEPSRLLEREEVLEAFHVLLGNLIQDGKATCIIRGQPGSGKTRFLREALGLAKLQNYCIWSFSNEKNIPETDANQEAIIAALESSPPSFSEIQTILRSRGQAGLICGIDNMESFDSLSARWLEILLSPDNPIPTLIVWTCMPGTYTSLGMNVPASINIEMAPLTQDGMQIYLRSVLHWDPPETFLSWLYRQTGGFPKQIQNGLDRLIRQNILQFDSESGWELSPTFETIDLREWLTKTSSSPPNNLPSFSTSFLGRESELESIRLLLANHRLVTLTGPGGIGKTRLALQAAHYCLSEFPDGAFMISLSELRDPQLLLPTVARAIGIMEQSEQPVAELLFDFIRDKRMLLVLDTFEQIIQAAVMVANLLSRTPRLRIIVTSRQPLRISGEQLFPLPPLVVPADIDKLTLPDIARSSAVALFVARAQSVRLDFHLTPENSRAIAELCSRLDGVPLAIELAAARIAQYSPQEMIAQDSLTLLSRAPTDYPLRHQTLRSVVRWSVDLLTSRERNLFAILSLFSGWFSREAVYFLCQESDQKNADIANSLLSLCEQNLLMEQHESDGAVRYNLMLSIREVGMDMLRENPRMESLQRQFAEYYRMLAENRAPHHPNARQKEWLDTLSLEHSNLQSALDWLLDNDPDRACRMSIALCPFWEIRNLWSEAHAFLNHILANDARSFSRAIEVYRWDSHFARLHGELDLAETMVRTGIEICQQNFSPSHLSPLLQELGWVLYAKGERADAKNCFIQALQISREAQDTLGIASACNSLAWSALNNADFTEAMVLFEESLSYYRKTDSKSSIADVLRRLARVHFVLGNYAKAEEDSNESLDLSRELGDLSGVGRSMHRLGDVFRASGDYERVKVLMTESVNILEKAHDREGMAESLVGLAEFTRSLRKYTEALPLYKRNLDICHSLGLRGAECHSLTDMAEIYRHLGQLQEAEATVNKSIGILQVITDKGGLGWAYRCLGEIALMQKDLPKAHQFFNASLQLHLEKSEVLMIILDISGFLALALDEHKPRQAAVLAGAIESLFEANRHRIALDDVEEYTDRIHQITKAVPQAELDSALAEGRSLSIESALRFAMNESSTLSAPFEQ